MDILDKIEKLRIAKGWSLYRFAEECMITPSTLANMFARKTLPSITTLISICKGCGISLSEFFADDEPNVQSEEERELINNYRKLNKKNREAISQFIKNVS